MHNRRNFSFSDLHERLLEQYAPPSVLVNSDYEIVHLTEHVGRFLRHAGGIPSHNLLSLIRPELRLALQTAMAQAMERNKHVEARRVRVHLEERTFYVNITIRPIHSEEFGANFVLVLFDEVEDVTSECVEPDDESQNHIIRQVDEEGQRSKPQLEISNEKLKASNEELRTINEELRSAIEELETSRKEMLIKEKSVREQAQAANDIKDELLAIMSHELKHPLNLIHVNAELLTRIPQIKDVPTVARAADTIRRTVMSQAQIIDDLLDLSRARMGKLALNRSGVPWTVVINDIIASLKNEARDKKIALVFEAGDDPMMVFVDPTRLEQIVWNLLSNALKFTPSGGWITVRLSQDEGYGKLEIIDNGQGIAPEFIDHVFDMFRQASGQPTTRKSGGLGIGCALVRQLAEAHGGRVSVASAGLGQGSHFTVWLPLYDYARRSETPRSEKETLPNSLSGHRVLLVDDTHETLEAFGELLRTTGVDLNMASDAQEALKLAQHAEFDLVISDIAMPGMDGYEFIRKLREQENMRNVPAIALTGFGRTQDAQRAIDAGFDAHLSKPVSLEVLIDATNDIFIKKSAHD